MPLNSEQIDALLQRLQPFLNDETFRELQELANQAQTPGPPSLAASPEATQLLTAQAANFTALSNLVSKLGSLSEEVATLTNLVTLNNYKLQKLYSNEPVGDSGPPVLENSGSTEIDPKPCGCLQECGTRYSKFYRKIVCANCGGLVQQWEE